MGRKIAGALLILFGVFNALGIIIPIIRGKSYPFPPLYFLVVVGLIAWGTYLLITSKSKKP